MLVLDASAVLALLRDEPGADEVERAVAAETRLSAVNWAEVLSKLADAGEDPGHATGALAAEGLLGESMVVEPLDEAQAVEIARLRPLTRGAGLSLGDRACLALAAALEVPALTADRAWAELGLGISVELIR